MSYARTETANLTQTHLTTNLFCDSQMNCDATPAALLPIHTDNLRYTAQNQSPVSCSTVTFQVRCGL